MKTFTKLGSTNRYQAHPPPGVGGYVALGDSLKGKIQTDFPPVNCAVKKPLAIVQLAKA